MAKAHQAIEQDNIRGMKNSFICAGLLTLAFLAGQLLVWEHYNAMGYFLASNPANTFFYLVTATHGLHLLIGLLVWSKISLKLMQGVTNAQLCLNIDLCAAYWHFLLLVWFVLFGLLILT